jgi:hypothetical protein
MRARSGPARLVFALALPVGLLAFGLHPALAQSTKGTPLTRITIVGDAAEIESRPGAWAPLATDTLIRTGDRIRTRGQTLAHLDFPWTAIALSSGSTLRFAPSSVLTVFLEQGRLEQSSKGADIIKVRLGSTLVRGRGQVVMRYGEAGGSVTALNGAFRITSGGQTLALTGPAGASLRANQPAVQAQLPAAPRELAPGSDPMYVAVDAPTPLKWSSPGSQHHVTISTVGTGVVVYDDDVGASPASVALAWPGTFRWRVSILDPAGIEGPTSPQGTFCVIEK